MNLSDCVTLEDRLPGYTEVPTERLYAEAKAFRGHEAVKMRQWLESFREQGYTKSMAWMCFTVTPPFPTVLLHIVAEAPCK